MLGVEEVLGAALPEEARGVDDQHLLLPLGGLLAAEDHDAAGEAGAVEEVRRQADDRLDQVLLEQRLADLALGALAEQRALREDDGHAAGSALGHRRDHVLDEGVVAVAVRRAGRTALGPRGRSPRSRGPTP